MSTQIKKFKLQEKIRRLYFRHRGNILAVVKEAELEDQIEYVRQVCTKIKRSFASNVNFEIACFVTDALLSGREQRLIFMEDRVKELLSKQTRVSVCCSSGVTEHKFDDEIHFKCNSCLSDCTTRIEDGTNDMDVVRYIDRMRKEDELIYKFMVTMGFISKLNKPEEGEQSKLPKAISVDSVALTEEEIKLHTRLKGMPPDVLNELRKTLENSILDTPDQENAE